MKSSAQPVLIRVFYLLALLSNAACTAGQFESATPTPSPAPTATLVAGRYSHEDLVQMFDYDRETPLDIQEAELIMEENGVERHDISFAGVRGERVSAFLVNPPGEGPYAGVLFMHWGRGSRSTFVSEALDLAEHGVVSLMIDTPFKRDSEYFIDTVKNLRRGADLLAGQPGVEADRLAYVGHSWGASFGAILADVDRRFQSYILMAGVPSFSDFWDMEEMIPLDATHYLGNAAPASLSLQFARQDENVSNGLAMAFYDAGSEPKHLAWYETDHAFKNDEARQDRLTWLVSALELP